MRNQTGHHRLCCKNKERPNLVAHQSNYLYFTKSTYPLEFNSKLPTKHWSHSRIHADGDSIFISLSTVSWRKMDVRRTANRLLKHMRTNGVQHFSHILLSRASHKAMPNFKEMEEIHSYHVSQRSRNTWIFLTPQAYLKRSQMTHKHQTVLGS